MIRIQNSSDIEPDFFSGRINVSGAEGIAQGIIDNVRARGDAALAEYSRQFDISTPATFEIATADIQAAARNLRARDSRLYDALCYSRDLALRFALKQKESFTDFEVELEPGIITGQRTIAVERAGVYVPAGRFPLVSTVVMTVMPAVAAGVKEIVMCTPPRMHPCGSSDLPYADEGILAAAGLCGATRVFAAGGAQAIAALAYGTQSIPKVDVIVGPGNKFVAAAKKIVYGAVGIDMLAGPTEVFIIADKSANPEWIAADMLAQAEHDVIAQAVLATPEKTLAERVAAAIERQLSELPTRQTAEASINDTSRIIITRSMEEAADIANRKAPEHLELAMQAGSERDRIEALVHNYGSLFIGHGSAEVLGDYAAGLNHTLPTSGSARYTGGLSVRAFLKTLTTLRTDAGKSGYARSAESAGLLGDAEGLAAHAQAARIRLD